MSNPIITVENLSKLYRIGAKEQGYKTFREAIIDCFTAPIRNFNRLRNLTIFDDFTQRKAPDTKSNAMNSAPCPMPSSEEDVLWALKDISFEVRPGEIVGIIGRNGAGKSTLLKILSRVTEPSAGDVKIYGRVASLLEVGTGFHPELTGRENIFLNGSILGMRKEEIKKKFDEIVAFAEIERFIDTPVKRYSSGMYVRLAFAVAAHLEPEIMIVDEVLAVGDAVFQKKCLGKMGDIARGGRTVLFVSHNMAAIGRLCERVLLLEKGCLAMDDTSDRVIVRYLDQNKLEGAIASSADLQTRTEGFIRRENPYIRFREIALLDRAGLPRKSYQSDEDIVVAVTFECIQSVLNLCIMLYIVDENNTPILETHSTDDPNTATTLHRMDQGVYTISCILPKNTFGERLFFLTVHLEYPKTEHLIVEKILEFEVHFVGYNKVHSGGAHVFIRPRLSWNVGSVLMSNCTEQRDFENTIGG